MIAGLAKTLKAGKRRI